MVNDLWSDSFFGALARYQTSTAWVYLDRVTKSDSNEDRDRWKQVEELFNSALLLAGPAREAFLSKASDDESLLEQVRSLLKSSDHEDSFMDEPAFSFGLAVIQAESEAMIGESIDRYQLLRLVGCGGMSEVYLAHDSRLGRDIALKLLPSGITSDPRQVRRFEQEARAASAISHPNVGHIYEIGESQGRRYIAMEYVAGNTLREVLKGGALGIDRAIQIVIEVLGALKAAHDVGVVHRDIKPENIMLREDGYVKVLDFGIAKLIEERRAQFEGPLLSSLHTEPEVLMGTSHYMSPEQLRKQAVSQRTDLWSVGVLLYEVLAGRRPFQGAVFSDVVISILEDEPLSLVDTNLPLPLQQILAKALCKDQNRRYQNAADMLADLRQVLKSDSRPDSFSLHKVDDERETENSPGNATLKLESPRRASGADSRAVTVGGRLDTIETKARTVWSRLSWFRRWNWSAVPVLLLIVGIVGTYGVFQIWRSARIPTREFNLRFNRVDLHSSSISDTAISPDGKYVASVTNEVGKQAIHIMELATSSDLRISPPSALGFSGLTFSADGNYLYYLEIESETGTLYRVSKLGGGQRKILANVNTAVGFSQDGTRIAFVRHNTVDDSPELTVAFADGTSERLVAKRTRADTDSFLVHPRGPGPVWSPDGKAIACPTRNQSSKPQEMNVEVIDPETGSSRRLNTRRWFDISGITWLNDGGALVVAAKDNATSPWQLVWLSYPGGESRNITNDPNNYTKLSGTRDSGQLLTLNTEENSSIWLVPADSSTEITPANVKQRSGVSDITYLQDGRFLYSAFDGEYANLWVQDPASGSVNQLTFEHNDNYRPAISPDQRFIVFVTSRAGPGNIWRMNLDGTQQRQLTFGSYEDMPAVTPDGKWVIYRTGRDLSKVSIDGGPSTKLLEASALFPVVSPDGLLLAFLTNEAPNSKQWTLKVCDLETLTVRKRFELPEATNPFAGLRWSPNSQALIYVTTLDGAANLWLQSLDGSSARQLTRFKDAEIQSFAWSWRGEHIACVRNTKTTIPILVRLF